MEVGANHAGGVARALGVLPLLNPMFGESIIVCIIAPSCIALTYGAPPRLPDTPRSSWERGGRGMRGEDKQ